MSESDEMFKELGYTKNKITNEFITYSRKELRYKIHKEWELCISFNCYDKYLITKNIQYYSLQLLQAINKKCQELGWLDE
jgi:hypothetical protein